MLLYGAHEYVARWVALQIDPKFEVPQTGYTAIGILDEMKQLIGGCVYTNYRTTDIEIWMAGFGRWVTPNNFRKVFRYPFYQLGVRRVSAIAKRKNKRSREMLKRLHFQEEGIMRDFFSDGQDAFIYGLLKKDYEQYWERRSFVRLMNAEKPALVA